MADNLNADLSCPICIDFFTEPVSLECGHSFCRDCILNASRAQGEPTGSIACPQCRQNTARLAIRSNRLLANIVEGFQRLWQPQPAGSGATPAQCQLHQQELRLFCSEDLQLICRLCWSSDAHSQHSCTAIKSAYTACKEHTNRLQEQMAAEFAELQHFLQQRERALVQRLRAVAESAVNQLVENMALISERCVLIEQALEEIQSTQEQTQFLREIKGILQRCDLQTKPALKTPELHLGEFNGPLQYTVWKQMLNIISPAPVPLTLDSESASLDLVLSKDQTMVKGRSKLKEFSHHAKRFSNYGCVLAREGFTTGKHYWEVNVESIDEWIIGAVKESIDRHSAFALTPSNGLWTLRKWNGNIYGPHHATESECCQNMNLQKVGVCVDYEGGQVSFYNADDMTHLYTSTDRFTEKIYPFFLPFPETMTKGVLKLFHLQL
ncbi:zinc-binding protein A33-like isoform X2 [Mustelus asterias]